ncbi:hypothetical protein BHE74_00004378 [Ensete ventricosum]|nr:hypothetical protein GW17_00008631 [Ensete ventricosum]RWW86826.1 hypothetical protein BHE74_00004378 [Ensete ventricosum]RZR81886.1 hypothetical protein BHM03_00008192 [Ensete ventricosum]
MEGENTIVTVDEKDYVHLVKESQPEDILCSEMEMDENENGVIGCADGSTGFEGEMGEESNVVFSREAPILTNGSLISKGHCCGSKVRSKSSELMESEVQRKDKSKQEKKLSRQERIELGRLFQGAVSSQDLELAENLILLADPQTLNDMLCIALDSIWFLTTRQELNGITGLIKNIVANGANDFTRAALRTSFLASCVSACQSKTMSLADTVGIMAHRLHERLQECHGDEVLKAEAGAKVQKFTEWALKCIGVHSRCQENKGRRSHSTILEVQLQLSAFKNFLDLAGNNLTGKDFTEAFDAACFPLTLFSTSGISTTVIQGLLGMLVEGGADNVNQCFLEASRFGSTELVRILLQVVQWFVDRGCRDMELCLALTAAASSSQVGIASYLLPHIPQHVLAALSVEVLKAAGERSSGSLDGVAFLLRNNFLGDPAATYAVADSIARSSDEAVAPNLRAFLKEHWSEAAYTEGFSYGQNHYVNFMRILRRGGSPICLKDLPPPLVTAIAYLPLYRECLEEGGQLLPQKLRGQLVEAASRVGGRPVEKNSQARELIAILEQHLPTFFLQLPTIGSTLL